MAKAVVFSTPGLIPLEAFTAFGVNAKPNSKNPIGFFGTGLKYAIAVLVRNKCKVDLWIGHTLYTFYSKETDFRGKKFDFIQMKRTYKKNPLSNLWKKSYHTLPFTTELGKNWELWQAFRELYANTMDEEGLTYVADSAEFSIGAMKEDATGHSTYFVVSGDSFVDEYYDRHRNFLEDGLQERSGSEILQVLDRPSKHVYYRGMRVMDLKEEAQYTYNFLRTIELTEDRTAKYPFLLESWISDYIMQLEDEEKLRKVVPGLAHPVRRWEHTHTYSYAQATPSKAFLSVAQESSHSGVKEKWDEANPAVPTSTILSLKIPKAGMSADEIEAVALAIFAVESKAVLTDTSGNVWKDTSTLPEAPPQPVVDAEGDDVPF